MPLTRKRVLVTGGAGFLGSHLCERLLREGDGVLCVDTLWPLGRFCAGHGMDGLARPAAYFRPLLVESQERGEPVALA